VHEPKKNFYRRFIYEPFPVESSLHEQLTDHLNAEVHAKTITNKAEAIDYVTWTYFFRRLTANPSYYDPLAALSLTGGGGEDGEDGVGDASFGQNASTQNKNLSRALIGYIERLMDKCLSDLVRAKCIRLKDGGWNTETSTYNPVIIEPLHLGKIASL
jgi:hypothetical protein